jgi:hypothetical protein
MLASDGVLGSDARLQSGGERSSLHRRYNVMKSHPSLALAGVFAMALFANACLGSAEPPGTEGPVGEAHQAVVTCSSTCSDVPGAQPIGPFTCNTQCDATNSQVTCDSVVTYCASQCVADYGGDCEYWGCPACGGHKYMIPGNYNCKGVCEPSAQMCCCEDNHLC